MKNKVKTYKHFYIKNRKKSACAQALLSVKPAPYLDSVRLLKDLSTHLRSKNRSAILITRNFYSEHVSFKYLTLLIDSKLKLICYNDIKESIKNGFFLQLPRVNPCLI